MNAGPEYSEVVAARVGELRLSDVRSHVRDGAMCFHVVALQPDGPPLRTRVRLAQRWAGQGWHYMLGCVRCSAPTRVLRARGGELLCERCAGYLTERQAKRTCREWAGEHGDAFDRILRAVGRSDGATVAEAAAWARSLERAEEARVDDLEARTVAALGVVVDDFKERIAYAGVLLDDEEVGT